MPPQADPAKWHVHYSGKRGGPYTWDQVCGLFKNSNFDPSFHIWAQGYEAWVPATNVSQLQALRPSSSAHTRSQEHQPPVAVAKTRGQPSSAAAPGEQGAASNEKASIEEGWIQVQKKPEAGQENKPESRDDPSKNAVPANQAQPKAPRPMMQKPRPEEQPPPLKLTLVLIAISIFGYFHKVHALVAGPDRIISFRAQCKSALGAFGNTPFGSDLSIYVEKEKFRVESDESVVIYDGDRGQSYGINDEGTKFLSTAKLLKPKEVDAHRLWEPQLKPESVDASKPGKKIAGRSTTLLGVKKKFTNKDIEKQEWVDTETGLVLKRRLLISEGGNPIREDAFECEKIKYESNAGGIFAGPNVDAKLLELKGVK